MKQKSQKKKGLPKYKKPDWAVQQIIRESGLVEDICKHGVGHPNIEWLKKQDAWGKFGFAVHGCDGCCNKEMKELIKKSKKG